LKLEFHYVVCGHKWTFTATYIADREMMRGLVDEAYQKRHGFNGATYKNEHYLYEIESAVTDLFETIKIASQAWRNIRDKALADAWPKPEAT